MSPVSLTGSYTEDEPNFLFLKTCKAKLNYECIVWVKKENYSCAEIVHFPYYAIQA